MSAPSAKSLFRATKRKPAPRPEPSLLDAPQIVQPAPPDTRRDLDLYPTIQSEPVRGLLAADGEIIRRLGNRVWEPAVGHGDMAREIRDFGADVIGSDIADHGGWPGVLVRDFFAWEDSPAPAIVTNPPYNLINARDGHGRWLRHTLSLPSWRYCALLLSWDWPAAHINGLGALLDAQPFSYCYLLRWKVDFTGQGSPPQRNAWFVWLRDWNEVPRQMRFMDRRDARQGVLL